LSCSDAADPIVEELTARRTDGEVMIRNRLESAKLAGELPSGLEPSELARYVITCSRACRCGARQARAARSFTRSRSSHSAPGQNDGVSGG